MLWDPLGTSELGATGGTKNSTRTERIEKAKGMCMRLAKLPMHTPQTLKIIATKIIPWALYGIAAGELAESCTVSFTAAVRKAITGLKHSNTSLDHTFAANCASGDLDPIGDFQRESGHMQKTM